MHMPQIKTTLEGARPSFYANLLPASAEDIAWPSSGIEPWWRISCALCRGKEQKQEEWHVGIIFTMLVEYGPEVGDGGEGEHILGLRMHKAHFLSREPRHVSSTGEADVLVACGEARLVMDWKYLHLRTDVTRTRGL